MNYFTFESLPTELYTVSFVVILVGIILGASTFIAAIRIKTRRMTIIAIWFFGCLSIALLIFGVVLQVAAIREKHDPVNADGQSASSSLQSWMHENYGVNISKETARQLFGAVNPNDEYRTNSTNSEATFLYNGESVTVYLVPYGDAENKYALIDNVTRKPLEK